ncbi:MAG: hypothetical protein BIFFINMI_04107 [Phycisphaerae bacterium]|nr:hypothetical protein [Phycisphaerae bacterium]
MAAECPPPVRPPEWNSPQAALIWCPAEHVTLRLRAQLGPWGRDSGRQLIWVEALDDDSLMPRLARAADALSSLEARDCRVLLLDQADRRRCSQGLDWELVSRCFSADSLAAVLARHREPWLADLLQVGRLGFHYQPIVELQTARAFGYEALVRGEDRDGRTIGPVTMLAAARRMALLDELDRRARLAAVGSLPGGELPASARLFVNFLPETVYDPPHCLGPMFEAAQAAGVPADRLVLEVSGAETAGRHGPWQAADEGHLRWVLDYVRSQGAGVCIDDLGGGPAGLLRVANLEADYLKLDLELIGQGHSSRLEGGQLVDNLLQLAGDRNMTVIAERVESPQQLLFCRSAGIGLVQGRLLAEPSPVLPPRRAQRPWLARIAQLAAVGPSATHLAGVSRPPATKRQG